MKTLTRLIAVVCWSLAMSAQAAGPEDAQGLWMTAENDAVIRFAPCAELPGALCGTIVWDKDAGTPADTCGVRIAQLARYDKDAWRDGWVYDPRDGKKYKGAVRAQADELRIRAFVGVEILGQTEQLKRVATLPATPVCKS
ncbi:MAG: hypothetical protein A2W72_10075 [Burkholderiales bacterium RIFCSPLOWO2_12_67_14]|nr:MAG: hypothetical protein A3I64_20610 [Burkholderiales bacterium RIFCSPLOWO2_02_FULL_67_64]OGB40396.1 MAG: hypothetical protein A2W72_10075 [Burkholderiales bacterium RIFCSPLOWO2_12_67_14]OGB42247.1 MAG: hypothetical protein A3E51_16680 [Burkholderiales bacterium RIFCSPHIGHO2_12_FULL_67_38]OGB89342.1 MAG: hypothetical protein A3G82_20275 [Burkholderiales bacterium RIFCSPLOWO2_12_FULL_67_210]